MSVGVSMVVVATVVLFTTMFIAVSEPPFSRSKPAAPGGEAERFLVESRLTVAVVGGSETVQQKLGHLLQDTGGLELIFT